MNASFIARPTLTCNFFNLRVRSIDDPASESVRFAEPLSMAIDAVDEPTPSRHISAALPTLSLRDRPTPLTLCASIAVVAADDASLCRCATDADKPRAAAPAVRCLSRSHFRGGSVVVAVDEARDAAVSASVLDADAVVSDLPSVVFFAAVAIANSRVFASVVAAGRLLIEWCRCGGDGGLHDDVGDDSSASSGDREPTVLGDTGSASDSKPSSSSVTTAIVVAVECRATTGR